MLLFLFLLVSSISTFNFTEDYSILKKTEQCEDPCWFAHPEISPETISSWPSNCSNVCALLTFSSNSNGIPFETLKTSFKRMTHFNGVLRVENTTFTNLSFFGPKWIVFKTNELSFSAVSIQNNPKLSNVDILFSMRYLTFRLIQIINNPKLDVSLLCSNPNYKYFTHFNVSKNLKDCGCMITSDTHNYTNCTALFGNLEISNVSKTIDGLKNVKNVTGGISIHDTDFENLSFLLNLENLVGDGGRLVISNNPDLKRLGWDSLKISNIRKTIDGLKNVKNVTGEISIHDTDFENLSFLSNLENLVGDGGRLVISNNPNLKRLGWDSLKKVVSLPSGPYSATFQNNHPEFCLSMEEATALTSNFMNFTAFEARYCNITTRKDGQKTCVFTKMSNLDNGCVHIMGKVVIDSGDKEYTQKLENVTDIYGPLVIQNTTLSDLSFLGNLKHVAVLDGRRTCPRGVHEEISDSSPAIWLKDNLNLSDVDMMNLQYPFSPGPHNFVIENNSPDLFPFYPDCYNYQYTIYTRIMLNGKMCEAGYAVDVETIQEATGNGASSRFLAIVFLYWALL